MSNANPIDFAAIQKQLANRPTTVAETPAAPGNTVSNQSGNASAKTAEKSEFYLNITVPLPIPQEDGTMKVVAVNIGSASIRLKPYTEGTSGQLLEARKVLHQMVLNTGYEKLQPGEATDFTEAFPLPVHLEMRRPGDPNATPVAGSNPFLDAIAAMMAHKVKN